MDWLTIGRKVTDVIRKYKYVFLVLILGFVLMTIPQQKEPVPDIIPTEPAQETKGTAQLLEEILTQIDGVGTVRVLLTESAGMETIYQTDEDHTSSDSSGSVRVETVILSDSNRKEQALVRKTISPIYQGAIVVCQGADRPSVQLAIVNAVSNTTGISADRISVLKMK